MNELTLELTVPAECAGQRIDQFVCGHAEGLTRNQLARRSARFFINSREVKASRKVQPAQQITVMLEELPQQDLAPEHIPLDIRYEDESVLVISKEPGVVVHPGAGNEHGTVIHGVLHHCREMAGSFPADAQRPGIVHRLDKDTSGIMIIAKDPRTHEMLARQFSRRRVHKTYIAVVRGMPPYASGSIETHIVRDRVHRKRFIPAAPGKGRSARTDYRVLKTYRGYTLVQLHPVTGRTHQLRVHMKHIGCPIAGDSIYGSSEESGMTPGLLLHAFSLQLKLPEGERRTFRAPLPERFSKFLTAVRDAASQAADRD